MNRELFDLIFSENGVKKFLEEKKEKKKFYKEYEEAVKKFLEDGAVTDKMTEMEAAIVKCCNVYVDLLSSEELVEFLLNKISDIFKSVQGDTMYAQINSVIEYGVFLGKISALYSMFCKKEEEIRKNQEYRRSIEQVDGLKKLLNKITEDNVSFVRLCEISSIDETKLNCILNKKSYFNVRNIGQQKLVSLAPEGKKLQKYLKLTEEKRYSQEEVEDYIYMNSHRLINMFRHPKEELPRSVTVIPLSDIRQDSLAFEFRFVHHEISLRALSDEWNLSAVDIEIVSENETFVDSNIEARRSKNAKPCMPKLRKVSKAIERNFASSKL